MRQVLVGLLVLPGVVGGAAALRAPTAAARADEVAAHASGAHAAARLTRWLSGRFVTQARATADGTIPAVVLRSCRVTLPAVGERVLYVERAFRGADGTAARPFDQALWAIDPMGGPGQVRVRQFALVDPAGARNLCDDPGATPPAAALDERSGCALRVHAIGHHLRGATEGAQCPSAVNGARYATRTLEVHDDAIVMADQGFDGEGNTVWGARGAQRFTRTTPVAE